jgi:hypothetical protein
MNEKNDDIAHPDIVSKPLQTSDYWPNSIIRHRQPQLNRLDDESRLAGSGAVVRERPLVLTWVGSGRHVCRKTRVTSSTFIFELFRD